MSWIGPAISIAGGLLQGESARGAAEATANANVEAARIAAEAAKFRPFGLRTRASKAEFQTGPEGYVSGATYTPTPEFEALQNRIDALNALNLGFAEQAPSLYQPLVGGAQRLFSQAGLGLKATPEEQAADWLAKQQALLAPQRERESALLANQLQNTGRTGFSIAQGGGLLSANPEQAALANARALQDLQLAAQATQAGQQMANFYANQYGLGGGLLSQYGQGLTGGYAPFSAGINVGRTLEGIAQEPLLLGAGLGGQQAAYGAKAGALGLSGIQEATPYMYKAGAYDPLGYGLMRVGMNPSAFGLGGGNTSGQWTPSMFQNQQMGMYGGGNAGFGD